MKRLKDIDLNKIDLWWDGFNLNDKKEIELVWEKYIKRKDSNGVLRMDVSDRIRVSFIDGLLVGMHKDKE